VSTEELRPVDSSISVTRHQIPVAYTLAGAIVLAVGFTWAPWFLPASWITILMNFFILVIMATMWNLLAGYAGMVSIGQQAFIGLGAYATLYFAIKGMDPFVAIPLATIICAVIAFPVTYLLFRLRGGYFSVATWVVADSAMLIIGSIAFFGGGTGHYLPGLTNFAYKTLNHDTYLAAWFVALIVIVATYILLRSRLGLVLSSVRDNEFAARSSGAKVTTTRRTVFIVAAAGCGAAGAVLAISQPFIQLGNEFNLQWAAEMLFASMIGGLGTIEGPILGCIIYFVLQQTLQNYGAWYLIIFGALAVAVAIWQPRGIWGFVRDTFHFELLPVGYRVRGPDVATNAASDGPAIRLWPRANEEPPPAPDSAGAE
jgi:branched-chain amino acid transport system permease protein